MIRLNGKVWMAIFVFLALLLVAPLASNALGGGLLGTAIGLILAAIVGLVAYYAIVAGRMPSGKTLVTLGIFTGLGLLVVNFAMTNPTISMFIMAFLGVSLGLWAYTQFRRR